MVLAVLLFPVIVPVLSSLGEVFSSDDDPGIVAAVSRLEVGDCLVMVGGSLDELSGASCSQPHAAQVISVEPALRTDEDLAQRCELAFFAVVEAARQDASIEIPDDAAPSVLGTFGSLESACAAVSPSNGLRGRLPAG